MVFSASVGGLIVLAVIAVALVAIFGTKIVRALLKVAIVVFIAYLAILWEPFWHPYVEPIADTIKQAWNSILAGPRG